MYDIVVIFEMNWEQKKRKKNTTRDLYSSPTIKLMRRVFSGKQHPGGSDLGRTVDRKRDLRRR